MFGKKILTKVFAGLLFISLLISTFMPQLAFAGGGSPGAGHVPKVSSSGDFSIKGEKIWDDEDNEANARPSLVNIILYKNGKKIATTTTTAEENWQFKFDLINKPYGATYTIGEADLSSYNYEIKIVANPEISTAEILEYNWEQKHTSNNVTKVFVDNKEIIAVKTTSANFNSIILVWTLYPLSSLEKEEIKVSIENIPELKNAGGYAFISGLGAIYGDGTSENWIKIYKDNNGKQYIEFSHQKHWSMIFYGDIFVETQVFVTPSSITNIYKAPVLPTTTTEAPTVTTTSTEATAATTTTTEATTSTTTTSKAPTTEESTTTSTEETVATTTTTEASTTKETTTTTTEETVVTTTTTGASTTEETTTTTTEETAATTSTTEIPTTEETTTTTTAEDTTTTTTEASAIETVTTEEQVAPHIPPVISVEKFVKEKKFTKAGDKLHYSFIVKNDGIVPVVKLTVNDSLLGIEKLVINLADNPLMPDDSYTYELPKAYLVTEADLEAGKVANVLAVIAETEEGAKSEAEADVTTPWEQVSPQTPDLPQTGEYTGYRAGIYSLLLGGAVVLIAINRRRKIVYESEQAD